MLIKKIIIKNYKRFRDFHLAFDEHLNIIVGDNESGKSTLLEAIHLTMTKQVNGRYIDYELSPYLFNQQAFIDYKQRLINGEHIEPPSILIELYLKNTDELARFKGINNTERENTPGIYLSIQFNNEFSEEYSDYIVNPSEINAVPTEYYKILWYSFANLPISKRGFPIKTLMIDTTLTKLFNGTDYFISKAIEEILEPNERANLSLLYRRLRENFLKEEKIININKKLKNSKNLIPKKELTISLDVSSKADLFSNLTSYLDDIPFQFIGKGDQTILKMLIALEKEKALTSNVVLIEEPENHLSFSTMNMLIKMISEKCINKQLFITTHSAFILNKLGLENVILLGDHSKTSTLIELTEETQRYFKKLPGYDTLRLLLAKTAILVEGPSDELIVQKAYLQKFGILPIEVGIDVISVGLSFKRFLEIAKILNKDVRVVTDNDGNCDALLNKYKGFLKVPNITICYDKDHDFPSLEPQLVKNNALQNLNDILGKTENTKKDLINYMKDNKTECALKIFETDKKIVIPQYIEDAIE